MGTQHLISHGGSIFFGGNILHCYVSTHSKAVSIKETNKRLKHINGALWANLKVSVGHMLFMLGLRPLVF